MGEIMSSTFYAEAYENLASSMDGYFQDFMNSILSEETIELIKSKLLLGNMYSLNPVITDVIRKISNATVNIAVIGENGSGKSSLINALTNVRHEEHEAVTGVGVATMEPTAYKHPRFPNVTFWDLPDIETTNIQPEEYLEKVKFGKYDFFLIISATHFKESDVQLAKAIKKMEKNFYFIRSKVDIDVQNEQKCNPKSFDREKVLQQIRDNCRHSYRQTMTDDPQIFLVSSDDLSEYDFPILTVTLLKVLSAQKRHLLTLSLPSVTEEDIERKKKSLKQKIWLKALKAGLLSALPMGSNLTENDMKSLKERINKYRVLFGVDDASLENLAQTLQVPVEQLKAITKSPYLLEEKQDDSLGEMVFKCLEMFSRIAGGPLEMALYFRKTYCMQWHILDTVTNDAKTLLLKKRFAEKKLIYQQDKTI